MDIQKVIEIIQETDRIFFDDKLRSDVTVKGASDYVTRADMEISAYLHKRLKDEFPDVGFMSEEEDAEVESGADYWILDPIDGTTNFMHGLSLSAVSLGFCSEDDIKAGVIYIPYTKEIFWAEKGKGAYLNDKRIECSKNAQLSECLGLMEFNPYFKNDSASAMDHALKIFSSCQDIRTFGSAAVELAYIACGRADVFLGRYLKPWDYAAGIVIVEEAGGVVTNTDGKISMAELNQHIVAANSEVYEEFLALINGV